MVKESVSIAWSNADNYGNPSSFPLGCEIIITDANNKFKKTDQIVKDVKRNEEDDELKDTGVRVEIDHAEMSVNRIQRGPRYFDPPDSDYGNCYNCGEDGHTITNCAAANCNKPCFLCGSFEHKAKRCKQRKKCFYCKKNGHYAKECPDKSIEGFENAKICLKCGDSGHEIYNCKTVLYSVDDLKEIQCYICKCMGHLCCLEYGEGPSEVSCYRCGQLGHTGLKCTGVSSSEIAYAEASPISCYKCGQQGHKSHKCKTFAKRRRKGAKQSDLQNTDHVGVRSAPQELSEACKKNKSNGYSTASQPKRRGGWMDEEDEDPGDCFREIQSVSLSTQSRYRSNKGFHGNHASNDYNCHFQYEG
ncbi:hypothetical protein R6Q59_021803 [Mikania micrantha]